MRKRTEAEMERAKLVKAARTLIRLKHSLKADEEINDLLPETVAKFDASVSRGELQTIKADLTDAIGEV